MPSRPIRSPQKEHKNKSTIPSSSQSTQHGNPSALSLLILPSEVLVHVTATLDPADLLAIGKVCKRLRDLVADDHTWSVAFKWRFMNVPIETDDDYESQNASINDGRGLLLRRSENTWRNEFLSRWKRERRFRISRSTTISHAPVNSRVSSFLLLPDLNSVLAASLTYGIVSRSFAFTGKILKGYLDAHGRMNGTGIGNPNDEFAPDASVIALRSSSPSSEATSSAAKVAWGFLNGDVAVTVAPRVMELGKSARFVRCRPSDALDGAITALAFDQSNMGGGLSSGEDLLVSMSTTGTIALWDSVKMRSLWRQAMLEPRLSNAAPSNHTGSPRAQPTSRSRIGGSDIVAYSASSRTVGAMDSSGNLHIWTGFSVSSSQDNTLSTPGPSPITSDLRPSTYICVPCPEGVDFSFLPRRTSHLSIEPVPSGSSYVSLVLHYAGEAHAWRVVLSDLLTEAPKHTATKLVGGPTGALRVLYPSLLPARLPEQEDRPLMSSLALTMGGLIPVASGVRKKALGAQMQSFVLAGDSLGYVYAWKWSSSSDLARRGGGDTQDQDQEAAIKFLAHEDSEVSAIVVDGAILATGSAHGEVKIYDNLTYELLRTLSAPSARFTAHPLEANNPYPLRVSQLVVRGDVVMLSIDSRVYAWKAEIGRFVDKGKGKSKRAVKLGIHAAGGHAGSSKWMARKEVAKQVKEFDEDEEEIQDQVPSGSRSAREAVVAGQEQLDRLAQMGLDEGEALEYVLMLSRDEETRRRKEEDELLSALGSASTRTLSNESLRAVRQEEQLVFDMTDDVGMDTSAFPPPSSSSSTRSSSRRPSTSSSSSGSSRQSFAMAAGRLTPVPSRYTSLSPSHSPQVRPGTSTKLQISPRPRVEPMEAGGSTELSMSPLSLSPRQPGTPAAGGVWQIPTNSRTTSTTMSDWASGSVFVSTVGAGSGAAAGTETLSSSPGSSSVAPSTGSSGQRSWSSVARLAAMTPSPPDVPRFDGPPSATDVEGTPHQVPRSIPSLASLPAASSSRPSLLSANRPSDAPTITTTTPATTGGEPLRFDNEDDELQYVLQLSLAEARSRGEDV